MKHLLDLYHLARGSLSQLIYPRLCAICHGRLVRRELAICPYCALGLKHYQPYTMHAEERLYCIPAFRHLYTLYAYERGNTTQRLIHALKYEGHTEVATLIGRTAVHQFGSVWRQNAYDAIIVVPLEPKRLSMRGYNQSLLIAQEIAQAIGVEASDQDIIRVKGSHSQTQLSREERMRNADRAFRPSSPNIGSKLAGKRVLLVDDVLTTGSTLVAISNILEDVGVDLIDVFTSSVAI